MMDLLVSLFAVIGLSSVTYGQKCQVMMYTGSDGNSGTSWGPFDVGNYDCCDDHFGNDDVNSIVVTASLGYDCTVRLYAGASWDTDGHDWEEFTVESGTSETINHETVPDAEYDHPDGVTVWSDSHTQVSWMVVSAAVATPLNSNGCQDIDGGGWQLVRHVSPTVENGRVHPAEDSLSGEEIYGTFDNDAQSLETWSIEFNSIDHNQFLFAFGDCSEYLVATYDAVLGELYSKEDRCILTSSRSSTPYTAEWYNRGDANNPEDPWVSTKNHWDCRDDGGLNDPCMVYGENSAGTANHGYGFTISGGGNVWIRQKDDEDRDCEDCTSELTRCCKAWGDPHITTLDGIYYHPQGTGYFDYITSCYGSTSTQLPFSISARQEACNGAFTCVRDAIVIIGSRRIKFPSNSAPFDLDTNDIISGTYSFDDGTNSGTYTASTYNFAIEYEDENGDEFGLKLAYKGTTLQICVSDNDNCLQNKLCGLCGYFDGDDGSNDFKRCDDGEEISSSGTSSFRGMSNEAWENTNNFGDSCCNVDLNDEFGFGDTCPSTDEDRPDEDCLDAANGLCDDAFDELCDCSDDVTPVIDETSFIEGCEIDVCELARENGLTNEEVGNLSLDDALDGGYLDTSLSKCEVDCDDDDTIDTDEPSNSPTEEPLILT